MSKYALCDGTLIDVDDIYIKFDINVIAHHLSKIQRYNGALPIGIRYSVAEHCINLCNAFLQNESVVQHLFSKVQINPLLVGLHALLHDAAEAYTGDLVSPIKRACVDFQKIESKIESQLHKHYLQNESTRDVIKLLVNWFDKRIVLDEIKKINYDHYKIYKNEIKLEPLNCEIIYNLDEKEIVEMYKKIYHTLIGGILKCLKKS